MEERMANTALIRFTPLAQAKYERSGEGLGVRADRPTLISNSERSKQIAFGMSGDCTSEKQGNLLGNHATRIVKAIVVAAEVEA